jgi:hypothetical protein
MCPFSPILLSRANGKYHRFKPEDFINSMRSGGDVGTSHQYNTKKLSASGGQNLYQYLLSLAGT